MMFLLLSILMHCEEKRMTAPQCKGRKILDISSNKRLFTFKETASSHELTKGLTVSGFIPIISKIGHKELTLDLLKDKRSKCQK